MSIAEGLLLFFIFLGNQALWYVALRDSEKEARWLRENRDFYEQELTNVRFGVSA